MPVSVHQRGTPDWLGLLQAAGILVISAGIWLQYKSHQADELEWKRVTEWLKLQDFQKYEQLLYSSGEYKSPAKLDDCHCHCQT